MRAACTALLSLLPFAAQAQLGDLVCHAIDPRATDEWCTKNCNLKPPYCLDTYCACDDGPSPSPTPSPSPAPPTPTPVPTPPPPPPSPVPPSGDLMGFWDGWVASHAASKAPATGWFFSFPGMVVTGSLVPSELTNVVPPPAWGNYDKQILTQGGGDTGWGNSMYKSLEAKLSEYKPAGWDGVCWDWETVGSDHTSEGLNTLMRATQAAGLINILTSTAEGPYIWNAANKDATDIDWSLVDYFVPQMYGASGGLPAEWETYAEYWASGAGKPTIHDVTFAPIPMEKILWGMPAGACDKAKKYGGSGCVEWAYSPAVHSSSLSV